MSSALIELPVATGEGVFVAHYSEKGLAGLDFPRPGSDRRIDPLADHDAPAKVSTEILRWHWLTSEALKKVLTGRAAGELPPLDWSGKTEFQKSVWRALLKLAAGQTKSYGEIAADLGKPRAVRAVGGACGANPIPVLVPCHRVLAANRKLGGFSGGLDWKRNLLAREGSALFAGQIIKP